ncbi:MAG TPA: PQQ-dependent sugar dehydrogenase [Myxococcota bacterium]|nr:PQQ-dependent sugar dehydrogenase [Myxococcota bacterium]
MAQLRSIVHFLMAYTFAVVGLLSVAANGHAAEMSSVRVASGLSFPVYVTAPRGDPRLFILERAGIVEIMKNGAVLPTPFLDISPLPTPGERGLLGLAFAPDYTTSGFFYIYYTNATGDSVVARYRVSAANPDVADPASGTVVLTVPYTGYDNHKGGTVAFGPDGFLYLGLGDGGGENDPLNSGQRDDTLYGKMLRMDVSGALPATPTVWAKGLRNPYRFSFDRKSGDLWIGDVGQDTEEEVDFQRSSDSTFHNYGWRIMEGTRCNIAAPPPAPACNSPALTPPVLVYDHGPGDAFGCAIMGGAVYHGILADENNLYFYGDYCKARVWTYNPMTGETLERTAELKTSLDGTTIQNIVAISEDGYGELYIVDSTGQIFRISLPPACGLGFELAPILLPLLWLRRRRMRKPA